MNILIINGSPRPNGNIARILEAMKDEAVASGATVNSVIIKDSHVKPCIGCMACRTKLRCIFPDDDAQATLRLIDDCDIIIIGAPCYWGNIPGQLKSLFDRIVYGMMGEDKRGIPVPLHKGKKAILVSTCTTPFPFNIFFNQSHGAIKALKEILKWSGFKTIATIEKGGTKEHAVSPRLIAKCRKTLHKALK